MVVMVISKCGKYTQIQHNPVTYYFFPLKPKQMSIKISLFLQKGTELCNRISIEVTEHSYKKNFQQIFWHLIVKQRKQQMTRLSDCAMDYKHIIKTI